MMAKGLKKANLTILAYASNNCYVTVLGIGEYLKIDPSLVLDLGQGTWSNRSFDATPVGRQRSQYYQRGLGAHQPCKEGIIGIYDRTKLDHLNAMVHHATEATRSDCACMRAD
jgi:hypothetical protein